MSSMYLIKIEIAENAPAVRPFALMRDRVLPSLEERRKEIESMYSPVMGRPEADPVMLTGVTVLQGRGVKAEGSYLDIGH